MFAVCAVSSIINSNHLINHLIQANKVSKNTINQKVILTFLKMRNLDECLLIMYSDSSYINLDNGCYLGGFITL